MQIYDNYNSFLPLWKKRIFPSNIQIIWLQIEYFLSVTKEILLLTLTHSCCATSLGGSWHPQKFSSRSSLIWTSPSRNTPSAPIKYLHFIWQTPVFDYINTRYILVRQSQKQFLKSIDFRYPYPLLNNQSE